MTSPVGSNQDLFRQVVELLRAGPLAGTPDLKFLAQWERPRSGTVFFHAIRRPSGEEIVIKVDRSEEPIPTADLVDAMIQVDDAVSAIPGCHGLRPLASLDEPPVVVSPFVDGDDLVTIMRRPDDPAWDGLMTDWMGRAGEMLAAFHSRGPSEPTADELSAIKRDVETIASKVRVDANLVMRLLSRVDLAKGSGPLYGDFGPGNLLGSASGDLYLIDPPVEPPRAIVHRDLANFVFELRRQLAGRGFTPHPPAKRHFPGLHDAFLAGYSRRGSGLSSDDHALIGLFEARRAAGMARKRFPQRMSDVIWFARSAASRRREALAFAIQAS